MPLEERTIPSSRSVLTCKPAFPGGRFLPALVSLLRLTRDSKGSRRAVLSVSPAAWTSAGAAALSTGLRGADLVLGLAEVFEACGVVFAAGGATVAAPAELACANKLEEVAASKIATTRVFTERIVRSFRLQLSSRLWLRARSCSGSGTCIGRLGEECSCCKNSGNGGAWAKRVFRGLGTGGILEIQITHVDNSGQ